VVGELAYAFARLIATRTLQRFRDPPVQPGSAGRAEIVVQGVLYEGMSEREPARPLRELRDERRALRTVQMIEHDVFALSRHLREQRQLDVASDHRGQCQGATSFLAEPGDATADYLAYALGQLQA
jgi:hypothetical protein